MSISSRRSVVSASSLYSSVDANRGVGSGVSSDSTAVDVPTLRTPNPPFSKDLDAWMQVRLARVSATVRNGSGTSRDWNAAAGALRLYANHLKDTKVDLASNAIASLLNPSKSDYSQSPAFDHVFNLFKRHDATLQRDDVTKNVRLTSDDVIKGQQSLRTNGFSWHFFKIADQMRLVSQVLAYRELSMVLRGHATPAFYHSKESDHPHLSSAVYNPEFAPHLELASGKVCSFMKPIIAALGLSQETKDGICDALTDSGILAALAGVTAEVACDGGVILSVLATDGVAAVIAGPLETVVCDALGVYSGLAVTAACATMTCALNC